MNRCLTHFCSGWIDINLTVTPSTIPLLFSLLQDPSLPIRLATSAALLRMISKGLKEPGDKIQLIKVLSLREVLEELEEKTRAQQASRGDDIDEGEESYREALGRLLNALGLELVKLAEAVCVMLNELARMTLTYNFSRNQAMRCDQKQPRCSNSYFRSCSDLWPMSTTTPAPQCSPSCRTS